LSIHTKQQQDQAKNLEAIWSHHQTHITSFTSKALALGTSRFSIHNADCFNHFQNIQSTISSVSTEQIPGSEVTKATEAQRVPKRISLEFRLE
jgi:hypothetical protein